MTHVLRQYYRRREIICLTPFFRPFRVPKIWADSTASKQGDGKDVIAPMNSRKERGDDIHVVVRRKSFPVAGISAKLASASVR